METPNPDHREPTESQGRRSLVLFGLGNPGRQYLRTRHNLGFMLVDRLVDRLEARVGRLASDAIHHEVELEGNRLHLIRPLTWMNRSGIAVRGFLESADLGLDSILVAVDDVALDLGVLRLRPRGSDGGHNGLRSVTRSLGTTDWARLRLGCGPAPEDRDLADFVLGEFAADEDGVVDELLDRAVSAVRSWVLSGTEMTMSRFNG
jgi:PTH1 family peptidyl-tRNA hydrolase